MYLREKVYSYYAKEHYFRDNLRIDFGIKSLPPPILRIIAKHINICKYE